MISIAIIKEGGTMGQCNRDQIYINFVTNKTRSLNSKDNIVEYIKYIESGNINNI